MGGFVCRKCTKYTHTYGIYKAHDYIQRMGGALIAHEDPAPLRAGQAGRLHDQPSVPEPRGATQGSAAVHAGPRPSSYTTHVWHAPAGRATSARWQVVTGQITATQIQASQTCGGVAVQSFAPQEAALTQPKSQPPRRAWRAPAAPVARQHVRPVRLPCRSQWWRFPSTVTTALRGIALGGRLHHARAPCVNSFTRPPDACRPFILLRHEDLFHRKMVDNRTRLFLPDDVSEVA
jgi:hypothetical protein